MCLLAIHISSLEKYVVCPFFFFPAVLGVCCGTQAKLWYVGSQFPNQGWNTGLLTWEWSLIHWATREAPFCLFIKKKIVFFAIKLYKLFIYFGYYLLFECVCVCVCVCTRTRMYTCSVTFNSLQPHGLQPTSLLCPWNFHGVGCHFLLQGIFPTQGLNQQLWCLLHWQGYSFPLHQLLFTNVFSHSVGVFSFCQWFSLLCKAFKFNQVPFVDFCFYFLLSQKIDPNNIAIICQSVLPMFSSSSFMTSGLTFRSTVHFEFIFCIQYKILYTFFYLQLSRFPSTNY